MIRNLFGGVATKCRTIDKLDIFGDGSCKALYRFDGNANDESGNYHGTETNVTYGGGVYERGAVFNGSGYVNTILPPSLFALSTSWSASLWVNSSVIDANTNTIISNFSGTTPNYKGFQLSVEPTKISYGYPETSTAVLGNYTITSATNTWYHIVVSVVNGVTSLYIDGTFRQSHTPTSPINPVNNMAIGVQARDLTAAKHRGSIDQVRIFNRAITATEVATLYAECEPTSIVDNINPFEDGSLKALYKFDGDATDATGVYNGTPTNITYGTGKFGKCAVFNGSNSYVGTPITAPVGASKTLSVWVKSQYSTRHGVLDIGGFYIDTLPSVGKWQFAAKKSGTGRLYWEDTFNPTINDWTHICIVAYNDTSISIYKNGTFVSTKTTSDASNLFGVGGYIGKDFNNLFFNGSIDQLRIFNKALTPMEVASLYNETTPMEEPMSVQVDPFKDGSGKALYRLEGNALDESGNYNGAPTSLTYGLGRFGRCGVFNGSSSYVLSGYTLPAITTYSFSAWIKTTNTTSSMNIISDYSSSGANASGRANLGFTGTKFSFNMGNGSLANSDNITHSSLGVRDGNWHHLCIVISGFVHKLYIDGSLFATVTLSISAGTAGSQSYNIGRAGDYNDNYFNGLIDQVRIFTKALSQAEVTALYNEI